MTDASCVLIVRRYARASFSVFGDKITVQVCDSLQRMSLFLRSEPRLISFFQMTLIPDEIKKKALATICYQEKAPSWCEVLGNLLIAHKRAHLLPFVLSELILHYTLHHNKEHFVISSAHVLSDDEKKECQLFLTEKTGKKVTIDVAYDTTLIAGIRMQSQLHIWEHSVAKYLRTLQFVDFAMEEE